MCWLTDTALLLFLCIVERKKKVSEICCIAFDLALHVQSLFKSFNKYVDTKKGQNLKNV